MPEITPIPAPTLPSYQGGLAPIAPTLPAAAAPAADKSFPLDALLTTGLNVFSQVGQVRQATGGSARRQQRIAACGRRPLFRGRKRDAYNECLENAMGGDDRSYVPPPLPTPEKNNTMTFVLIGLGLVAVSGVAYFLLKKK